MPSPSTSEGRFCIHIGCQMPDLCQERILEGWRCPTRRQCASVDKSHRLPIIRSRSAHGVGEQRVTRRSVTACYRRRRSVREPILRPLMPIKDAISWSLIVSRMQRAQLWTDSRRWMTVSCKFACVKSTQFFVSQLGASVKPFSRTSGIHWDKAPGWPSHSPEIPECTKTKMSVSLCMRSSVFDFHLSVLFRCVCIAAIRSVALMKIVVNEYIKLGR